MRLHDFLVLHLFHLRPRHLFRLLCLRLFHLRPIGHNLPLVSHLDSPSLGIEPLRLGLVRLGLVRLRDLLVLQLFPTMPLDALGCSDNKPALMASPSISL